MKVAYIAKNWIAIVGDNEEQIINLGAISSISFLQTLSFEHQEDKYLIILTPNVNVFSDSDDSNAIWSSSFTGGKLCLGYENQKEWRAAIKIIKKALSAES